MIVFMLAVTVAAIATVLVAMLWGSSPDEGGLDLGDRRLATIVGWSIVIGGGGLATLPWFGTQEELRSPEVALASIAFGAVVAAPGVLAIIGVRTNRPGMFLPASIALVPLSFISFALVTLPLLVPAVMLLRLTARTTTPSMAPRTLVAGTAGTAQLLAALGSYVALRTERAWSHPGGGGGSTSGWVPWTTSTLVLVLVATAMVTTYAIAAPSSAARGEPATPGSSNPTDQTRPPVGPRSGDPTEP